MTNQQLTTLIKKQTDITEINATYYYNSFFFEHFLKRVALSKYKEKLVFKGGFLLQSVLGIQSRTTLDIDFEIQKYPLDIDSIKEMVKVICSIQLDDSVLYEILDISPIKQDEEYQGISVKLKGMLGKTRSIFSVDIATGDVVTTTPIEYTYNSVIDNESFSLYSYNIESILAEKLETVIKKGTINSRSKDLFDIEAIYNSDIDKELLIDAIINTFKCRNTTLNKESIFKTIEDISSNKAYKQRFDSYVLNHHYTQYADFRKTLDTVRTAFTNLYVDYVDKLSDCVIYFMRHGQDEQDKLGGWSSNHLTDTGKIQALNACNALKRIGLKKVITSDLNRAVETAQIVSQELSLPVYTNSNLREVNNGDLANLSKEEFFKKYPGLYFRLLGMNEHYPNGESPSEFFTRIKSELIRIINTEGNSNILIVSHGGVMRILESLVEGLKWSNRQNSNIKECSVMKLSIKSGISKLELIL